MINFNCSATSAVFVMPQEIKKHLKNATSSELKVIIYIFSESSVADEAQIASATGLSVEEVKSALSFWRGTGILSFEKNAERIRVVSETRPSEKTVSYSSAEIACAIEENEDIGSLLNYASQKIGKILTPAEQGKILSLVDVLPLDCAVVMGIIDYCVSAGKNSVNYIERTASRMYEDDGIDTYEKFEEYIERKTKEKTLEDKIRRIIGAGGRAFTKKEREIISDLVKKGISEELVSEAYERTISSIAKPSLSYMSKILDSWYSEGIKEPSDLELQKPFEAQPGSSLGAFRFEDFTERPDNNSEEE